jgi:hypothetical protein
VLALAGFVAAAVAACWRSLPVAGRVVGGAAVALAATGVVCMLRLV